MEIVDVKFKNEKYVFHYRVAGVIEKEGKYLVQQISGKDYYILPGGHVHIGETSIDAIRREIREEVGIEVEEKDCKLFCYNENIFKRDDKIEHWLEQYYIIATDAELADSWEFVENDIDGIKTLKYNFIESDKINEIDLKPEVLKEILKNKKFDNIFHNISCNIKK